MKKLILSLFILCSILSNAQISIPQVTGLPAALNSKVDKVTGKSLVADTLSAKIQPTATAVATKEPLLPSTPSNPESRFLNGNKQWAEIVLGSGGYASNVYFTNLTSAIVGTYKQTSGTHELTETIASGTCNNNEVLIHTYLFEQPVGITTVDAGVWRFTMNCKINSNVGDSKFKIVQFKRSSTGVETDMFTIYSNTIENTDYQNFIIETVQPSFLVDSLDRFGCRIYATTTTTVNKTISYKVGDGYASYLNTPLVPRHDQFRALNGNPNVQHLTAAQVTKVNNTSGTNTGDETTATIKTKLGAASSSNSGYLVNTDWAKFNTSYTSRIQSVESPLYFTAGTIGSGYASSNSNGLLSSTDWGTFNGKQNALGSNQTTALSNLTGINFNTVPKSTAGGYANSLITDDGTTVSVSGNLTATNLTATNTGDETLTSIKTKLGAASAVSDGYLTYNMFNIFNGKEPAITKNSGFNLPLGTTTGTVLEGRTFGTAANRAVGDFIQNQNTSAQSANMWINGNGYFGGNILGNMFYGYSGGDVTISTNTSGGSGLIFKTSLLNRLTIDGGGVATFSSTVNSTGFLLNGNNLTSSLTTNYLPKWNGSNFVNATAGTDYQLPITLTTNGTSGAATFSGNVLNVPNYSSNSVDQSLTTVNGSTSGNIVGSMPFRTANYKKVIVYVNSVSGNVTYTFPTQFNTKYNLHTNTLGTWYSSINVSGTSVTITGANSADGVLVIEGY